MHLSHPSYFEMAEKQNYEVCFDEFVPIHPLGDTPTKYKPLKLNVSKLCHVTHKKEAHNIFQTNCFKPKRKFGKSDDGCNPGRSYRNIPVEPSESDEMEYEDQSTVGVEEANEYMYEHISTDEEVFPGFYSWWGLYIENKIPDLKVKYPPNYLRDPPESIYGSTAFIIPFDEILESYASSRSCRLRDLRLRVGGTMRYKCEIAYVIIVCTHADNDLSCYDLITSSDAPYLLDVEGFIDGSGRIKDKCHFPSFTTCYYDAGESHEALNFAFYFPEEQDFTCQVDKIDVNEVYHTGCIHKREMYYYYDPETRELKSYEICPDNIKDKHRKDEEWALYHYKRHQNSM